MTLNRFRALELDVDLGTGEIRREGRPLNLPPRAIELLALLVAEPGRLVSREAIRKGLWKDGVHVDFDRSVNIYVNQLRKAFGDDARAPRYVETLPRRGYRFIAPVEPYERSGTVLFVLPFQGSEDGAVEAFAEGVTEQLTLELGRLSSDELRVVASSAARASHDSGKSPREIAAELSADYLVEGFVRRASGGARVGVRLIETGSQTQIWAGDFQTEVVEQASECSRVAGAVAAELGSRLFLQETPREREPRPPRAIAVLPFLDLSEKQELGYLCDGFADEIIGTLGRLAGLRVAPRTSSFQFKGMTTDVGEMGRTLGVEAILEGSVRRVRDGLKITAQLVSVRECYISWSKRYECTAEEVFDVQDDMAQSVVEVLRLRIGEGPRVHHETRDPAAYFMFLRARSAWYHRYSGGLERSIDYFQRAAEADPGYTSAHAGLAGCYIVLGLYGFLPPAVAREQASSAVERALSLDPDHAAALGSRAAIHLYYEWRWVEAERKFRRAVELDPTLLEFHATYSLLLTFLRRRESAMASVRRAQRIDPLSPYANAVAALNYLFWGETELAKLHCDRTLEVEPQFLLALTVKGAAFARTGELGEATSILRRVADLADRAAYTLGWLGWALATSGNRREAERVREELAARRGAAYVPSIFLAWIDGALGDLDAARPEVEQAVRERHPMLIAYQFPVYDALRNDPDTRAVLLQHFP